MAGSKEVIKELFVLLGVEADPKDFERAGESIDDLISLSKKLVIGMTAATAAVVAATVETVRYGDRSAKTARQVGLTAEEVQVLTYAAERGGATFEQLRTGLAKVQQKAAEARAGNKEYAKTFAGIGVSVVGANGKLKGGMELLTEVAAKLAKIPSAGERARVAMKLFEEGGILLLPFLTRMGGELPTLTKRWEELGGGLSNEAAAGAEDAADAMLDLRVASLGVTRRLGTAFMPTLTRVARRTVDWLIANRELIDSLVNRLASGVKFVVSKGEQYLGLLVRIGANTRALKVLVGLLSFAVGLGFVSSLGAAVNGIAKLIIALKGAQKAVIITKLVAFGEAALIGALFLGLALMAEDFITALQGGDSLFGRFVQRFSNAPSGDEWWITKQVRALYQPLRVASQMLVRFLMLFSGDSAEVQAAKDYWTTFWDDIVENWREKLDALLSWLAASLRLNPLTAAQTLLFERSADANRAVLGAASDATAPIAAAAGSRASQIANSFANKVEVFVDGAGQSAGEIADRVGARVGEVLDSHARQIALELGG